MRADFIGRTQLSPSVATFRFQPERPVRFLAGQYIELILPHADVDNRGDRRWFTISSAPHDAFIDITMRIPSGRMSSYKQHLITLRPGDTVQLGNVLGDFVVPKDKLAPLVFIADGIGLTPYISIIRDLTHRTDLRQIDLYHGVRSSTDRLFYDEFERYGVNLRSHTMPADGFALPAPLLADLPAHTNRTLYYLAGTQEYSELVARYLREECAVSNQRIALDYFTGYPIA